MAKKKYIQLPQGYLSYSQVSLWLADQHRYAQMYFDRRNELRTSNAGQEYGKVVADALENGIQTGDLLTDSAMLMLPKYDLADKEIKAEMKTKHGWIEILGKPDSMDSVTKAFYEYKTGVHPWTQKKVDGHLQLPYYAMTIYLAFGVVPPTVDLVWIETEPYEYEENGFVKKSVRPTGRVESFSRKITMPDILDTMALTSRVAKEIELAWSVHVPDPRLEW